MSAAPRHKGGDRRKKPKRSNRLDAEFVPPDCALTPTNIADYGKILKVPAPVQSHFAGKDNPAVRLCVLSWLAAGWSIGRSCEEAGINRSTLGRWRDADEAFNAQVVEAMERGNDVLEDAARFRAVEGTARPVYQGGGLVGYVVEHSDALMQMMLAGRRPQQYGKQRHEHSGPGGTPIPTKIEIEFVDPKGDK